MKRSERLARDGKIEVDVGTFEIATVVSDLERCRMARKFRYIGTDFDALYDGRDVLANIYEDEDGNLFAVIE